jgi:hypothetical protein
VRGEDAGVRVTRGGLQARRTLDVGEEEGLRPQLTAHTEQLATSGDL